MSTHTQKLADRVSRTADRLIVHARTNGLAVADLARARLPWFEVHNQAGESDEPATIRIFDEIGGSLGTSAKSFAAAMDEITAPVVHLRINSPGGSLFDGLAIMNTVRSHPAKVIVFVDGIAASAASIVAMGGDEVRMMPGSEMMIHDAAMVQDGNAADMAKASTFLDRQSDNVADQYRRKAGGDVAEWRNLMLAETWMFDYEAVQMGLADRVEESAPDEEDPIGEPVDRPRQPPFDIGRFGYRYAGRRAAPAPQRRRRGVEPVPRQSRVAASPESRRLFATPVDRRDAARRRSAAAGGQAAERGGRAMSRRSAPLGLSNARTAAFPAELRVTRMVEWRGQQRHYVFGHASVVDTPYEMWDEFGPYFEIVDGGGVRRALAAEPDMAFLTNHRGITLARTTSGSLALGLDDVGFKVDSWLNPKRQDVTDLVIAIDDKDITEMSFAFLLIDGVWSDDFSTFKITEMDLHRGDVSAVNYGANPYTDVGCRASEILADLDRLPAGAARTAMTRLRARSDVDDVAVELDRATRIDHGRITPRPAALDTVPAGRTISSIEAMLLDH